MYTILHSLLFHMQKKRKYGVNVWKQNSNLKTAFSVASSPVTLDLSTINIDGSKMFWEVFSVETCNGQDLQSNTGSVNDFLKKKIKFDTFFFSFSLLNTILGTSFHSLW